MKTILIPTVILTAGILSLAACSTAAQPASSPAASASASPTASAAASTEHAEAQPRLVVTYADSVEVLDFTAGTATPVATLPLDRPAAANVGPDGRHVYLVNGEAGTTTILDSGSYAQGHGDHFHFYTREASFRPDAVDGPSPVHVVGHDGVVAISNDGDGTFDVFDELGLTSGGLAITTIESGAGHHGVAVPITDGVLYTALGEGDEGPLPDTIVQADAAGTTVATYADVCPGLHGETHVGSTVLFGCATGVVVIDPVAQTSRLIPNPADAGELRIGSFYADADTVVGNWGSAGISLVDPEAGAITPVLIDGGLVAALRGPEGEILVLTADGLLHVLDESGAEVAAVEALAPFELPEGHGSARPSMTFAAGHIVISDPVASQLVVIDASAWTVEGAIALDSVPTSVVATGLDPHGHGDHDH